MPSSTASSFTYRPRIVATLTLALLSTLAVAAAARNQGGHLRTVHGTVFDAHDNPLGSAIVYLKNLRTMAVRTYISNGGGEYRFSGLDPNVDYELHAEHDSFTSASHTVSSFDSRSDIVIELRVNRKKPAK